ncbi:hypothetical protein Tco_0953299 [Tanacetum coccineum]|uniref:Reverse transcriptase Ty1/copia-type domain-containing protein n=1 Tax=Tanacetum coccineum TaxID=301880 RepID=A0ABQ5E0F4_9ASTR
MATARLDADLQGTPTDQTKYRSMIGGLMYLTSSRPDIAFVTFVCPRHQTRPTVKHLKEVKRIFRYLKQTYNMGLWYPKDSGFELIAYSDADHAGHHENCKSTSGGIQFLREKLVRWSSKKEDCTAMSIAQLLTTDQLVPVFKQYDLASANKKIDLINPLCPSTSKVLGEILRRHPLCFDLTSSASVSWIYMQQMWHTLKLDDAVVVGLQQEVLQLPRQST